MAKIPPRHNNDIFTSVISEIKKYTGNDPLLPWLQGIKKMSDSLPPQILKKKLPRFLQKCAQTFQDDRKYRNDLRYIRVWIKLMDFVDDPRALLKIMEINHIGTKRALFYQAYALYYVKLKKFEEAENMYLLGVQNLAEPSGELQKSYEEFLRRMEHYKRKKTRCQEQRVGMTTKITLLNRTENEETKQDSVKVEGMPTVYSKANSNHDNYGAEKMNEKHSAVSQRGVSRDHSENKEAIGADRGKCSSKQLENIDIGPDKTKTVCPDETVVFKFVDTAIVGKSEAEDACHHGLVDPTINLKEAMNAINDMFREPIELDALQMRKSYKTQPKVTNQKANGFVVFVDEDLDNEMGLPAKNLEKTTPPSCSGSVNSIRPVVVGKHQSETHIPQESFKIFDDDEYDNECSDDIDCIDNQNGFVFLRPHDLSPKGSDDADVQNLHITKFREDTVVGRFVGSAILDQPEVENACHHGLVEPTINLKEAMDAINSMFGKPLDFVKTNRSKNPGKMSDKKRGPVGFSIFADEDREAEHPQQESAHSSMKLSRESDLFEPTINTKKAMDDINEMFGMPLDF